MLCCACVVSKFSLWEDPPTAALASPRVTAVFPEQQCSSSARRDGQASSSAASPVFTCQSGGCRCDLIHVSLSTVEVSVLYVVCKESPPQGDLPRPFFWGLSFLGAPRGVFTLCCAASNRPLLLVSSPWHGDCIWW